MTSQATFTSSLTSQIQKFSTKTLVVGATGNTGKHVVRLLLEQNQNVKVICRSKTKMEALLSKTPNVNDHLEIIEGSIMDMSMEELKTITKDCTAVVSCLGHNVTVAGLLGKKDRRLVTNSVRRLTEAMPSTAKFILMGTDAAVLPGDTKPTFVERIIFSLLRICITAHTDNEEAAAHLLSLPKHKGDESSPSPEWCIVRPTNLHDGEKSEDQAKNEVEATKVTKAYSIFDHPPSSVIFGTCMVKRVTVAHFMVSMLLNPSIWSEYRYRYPVLHDVVEAEETAKTK